MTAYQFERVPFGFHALPHIRGPVAVAACKRSRRIMRADVASSTVGKRGIELARHMTVQADTHGTDHATTHRIKAVANTTVAVATEYVHRLTVGHLVMGRAQAVIRELVRKVTMAGQADRCLSNGRIEYPSVMRLPLVLGILVAIVADDAVQPPMG
jgi:hypothetical protein